MPIVTLSLQSQRKKPATDRFEWIEMRGRFSGPVRPDDLHHNPSTGEVVGDLVPDRYSISLKVMGFSPWSGTIEVGSGASVWLVECEHLCTKLPTVSELLPDQQRLLKTLDAGKTPGQIWKALSDNKMATFYQVTYALSEIGPPGGPSLSSLVEKVVVLGGAELTAIDTGGVSRTVIGWRMHVNFTGPGSIEPALRDAGFKLDDGTAHPTHSKFGFKRSYREKTGSPRMQVTTDYAGRAADIDIDAGAFHRSSPKDIYKAFAKRFPSGAQVYKVKSK